MAAQRRIKSRRTELGRNLKRLRSSGRVRTVTPPADSSQASTSAYDPLLSARDDDETDELRAEVRNLRRLHEVIHFLGSAPDLATLRSDILDLGISVSELRRGMLALLASERDGKPRFKIKATRGFKPDEEKSAETRLLKNMLNRCLARRETLIEGDILEEGILGHAHVTDVELGAVVCLPLVANGQLLGALVLDDPERNDPFTPSEQSLLRSFAKHAALSIHRVSHANRLRRKTSKLLQRTDRLSAEREQLERKAAKLKKAASSSARLACMLEPSYDEAKRRFTREYLKRALRRCDGDLRETAGYTGLPLARLVGLLNHLEIDREKPSGRWGQASR
jgi:transcriptional regulator with GAF, ATPase, and Fis domain